MATSMTATSAGNVRELQVGDVFDSIKDAKAVIRSWAIAKGVSYKSLKDEKHRWVVVCRDKTGQCPFRLRVSYSTKEDVAKITIIDPHTCPPETHIGWKPIQPTNGFTHVTERPEPDPKKPRRTYRKRAATELSSMIEALPAPLTYPLSSEAALKAQYVGRSLNEVPTPAAVIDVATTRRNCDLMLETAHALGISLRAHVKTHKTTELTRLQVGDDADVKIVVSTLSEAENLIPFLSECQRDGRKTNLLYGLPLPPSSVLRLGRIGKQLGPGSISVMVDHHEQLHALKAFVGAAGFHALVFVKVDTGYHRAGIEARSQELKAILRAFHKDTALQKSAELYGFYSHAGHSYGGNMETEAMNYLVQELMRAEEAATAAQQKYFADKRFIISVGATPTATSLQNILNTDSYATEPQMLKMTIERIKLSHDIEVHAGCYPLLDMQQLASKARPTYNNRFETLLSYDDLAFTILAEVSSLYTDRPETEALVAAGSLALGREPCKSYPGWGIVTNWGMPLENNGESGWMVGRLSQEHAILTKFRSAGQNVPDLQVGQRVRIIPNHACIAGAGFGWYLVVDTSNQGESDGDYIVDVWIRWRGW
ncbi:MAG: hypothetical protein M1834_008349 [Cirrosporium novae-zelandiae]|nr:MAG: hypothetical protein M1834_008349 [Cirrosporium novae-zelandiae]